MTIGARRMAGTGTEINCKRQRSLRSLDQNRWMDLQRRHCDRLRPDSNLHLVHKDIGMLTAKIPDGPLEQKWSHYRSTAKLVSAGNRRKLHVIVVGTGLSGSSLAASLGEMGYQVTCFCFQDTARRAHSVAAQGGVNACKNYKNDGDTVFRMFYDTIKGGDFRSREANVYRLAECSADGPVVASSPVRGARGIRAVHCACGAGQVGRVGVTADSLRGQRRRRADDVVPELASVRREPP